MRILKYSFQEFKNGQHSNQNNIEFLIKHDWNFIRVVLIYGACRKAMALSSDQSDLSKHYKEIANSFAEMLHQIDAKKGEVNDDEESKEEKFQLNIPEAHLALNNDLVAWAKDGIERYKVEAWAPEWESLNLALKELVDGGLYAETRRFEAAFQVEFLSEIDMEISAEDLRESLLNLSRDIQKVLIEDKSSNILGDFSFLIPELVSLDSFLEKTMTGPHTCMRFSLIENENSIKHEFKKLKM